MKDEFAGKKTRCKKCNALIEIPSADASLDPPDIGFMDDEPVRPAPAARAPVGPGPARSIYTAPTPVDAPSVARMPLKSETASEYAAPGASRVTTIHNARPGTAAATYAKSGLAARSANAAAIARADDPSVNGMSVMLGILFVLGMTVMAIVLHVQSENSPPWYFVPAFVLIMVGMFFICLAGGTTLGSFVTYKMFSQPVPSKLYLRAVGVNLATWVLTTGVGLVASGILYVLAMAEVPPVLSLLISLVVLVIDLAIAFKMYTQFLDLSGLRALLAMIFSSIFVLIFSLPAVFVLLMIIGLLSLAGEQANQMAAASEPYNRSSSNGEAVGAPRERIEDLGMGPGAAQSPEVTRLVADSDRQWAMGEIGGFKRRIADLDRQITPVSVRESLEADVDKLRGEIATAKPVIQSQAEFGEVKTLFEALDKRFLELPSREADAMVFQKAMSGEAWDTPAPQGFTAPMTVLGDLLISMPDTARFDLSADPATYPQWTSPDGKVTLSLNRYPRTEPKQEQPWIILPQMSLVARQKQLMYIVSDERKYANGMIGDLIFTRGERSPTDTIPIAAVRYVALEGDKWLVAEIASSAKDETWFRQFESSIRTLRRMKEGEPAVDPFSPQFMVERLADQPAIAGERLRKAGAAAEPALLKIAGDASHAARTRAVQLLSTMGTEESLPLLQSLVDADAEALYRAARAGVIRLDPENASELSFALKDLKLAYSEQTERKLTQAMAVLKDAKPDDRRASVAPVLENIVLTSTPESLVEPAAEALMVWQRPETLDTLLPMLNDAASENARGLDAAIRVLGATKDERVVRPILSWGGKRLDAVTKACVSLGATAEDDLIKMLSMNAQAKSVACDILKEMGSQRSIVMLERTARDRNSDAELQAKARDAVNAIRNRSKK